MKYEIRKTELKDIIYLVNNLRKSDKREVESASGQDAETCILHSYMLCRDHELVSMISLDGTVCIYGVLPSLDNPKIGVIFLLGTDLIYGLKKEFIEESFKHIEGLKNKYDLMYNWVHADNAASVIWLKKMGATILEGKPFGALKENFHYFEFRKETICVA